MNKGLLVKEALGVASEKWLRMINAVLVLNNNQVVKVGE